ncbi:MAG TPA: methyltransferase domain-containing protein [Ktedonobacteraceae bacterium]|nr:methyltransferase domain-containing protein [Ktedonobacteraceae bacterium]
MNGTNRAGQAYVMAFSTEEVRRLQTMAELLAPTTTQLLEKAGIRADMKVLDVGSGAGDVALLAADLVGPTGTVVGIESNPAMLDIAQARVQDAGLTTVSFVEGDLTHIQLDIAFDAIVGRLILQHLSDPVAALRHLVRHLRPGGIVAFQEIDIPSGENSAPLVPLYEQMFSWAREGLRSVGVDSRFGLQLYRVFLDAGLPAPQLHGDAFVGAGPDWGWYDVIAETIRSLLPVIIRYGIATAEEIGIDTLAERCREAMDRQRSVAIGPSYISAWTRI